MDKCNGCENSVKKSSKYDLNITPGSLLHTILLRISKTNDIRHISAHPLWCAFLDKIDIALRDKMNQWGHDCRDAYLREPLLVQTTRNQMKWNPDVDGYLNNGDTFSVTNTAGQSQKFKVRKNVVIGDTKLLFEPAVIEYIFLENDLVCLDNHQIYRRWDSEITNKTIQVDVPLPDPDSMSMEELVKSHTFLKNGQRMVINRKPVQGLDYGYAIVNNTIVLGADPTQYDVYELFIENPHHYA
jgi:hypothetical protein